MHLASTRIRAVAVTLSALLVGCASGADGEQTGQTDDALTTVCGATTTGAVQGYDVSTYQGDFNWATHKVAFGAARISDGTGTVDGTFTANWSGMRTNGVLRSAYQFFEPGEDEVAQADLVITKVGKLGAGDLPVMLDLEVTGGQTPATIQRKAQHWLDLVEAGTGKTPFVYSYASFLQTNLGSGFGKYPLWIAGYGESCPSVPSGWTNWVIWQYSDGSGALDHDVFNGTLATLTSKYGGAPVPPEVDGGKTESDAGKEKDGGEIVPARSDAGAVEAPAPLADAPPPPDDGGGCAIARAPNSSSRGNGFLLFGLVGLAIATMRRRSQK